MFDKYLWIQSRCEELGEAIVQPEIIADTARYQALLQERAQLEPQAEAWAQYQALCRHVEQAREMLSDPDLAEMAQEELAGLQEQKNAMEHELRILLLPRDPNDDHNVIIEIRAGAGGDEASLFGAVLPDTPGHRI